MWSVVQQQLNSCNFVDLQKATFDEETNTYLIKKYAKPSYLLNKCYIVRVAREYVNNASTLLAINWNSGSSPKSDYLKIFVSKTAGKMIYVDSVCVDPASYNNLASVWSGWLPIDALTQIMEVPV